jgi:hypothetical protein
MANPRDALAETHRGARELVAKLGGQKTQQVLKRAQKELERRIRAVSGVGGAGEGSFTAVQLRATLAHVRAATQTVQRGIQDSLLEAGQTAAEQAAAHTVRYLTEAERHFTGIARPLQLDEAAIIDQASSGVRASILRRLGSSGEPIAEADEEPHPAKQGVLERYGLETVGHFESILQKSYVARTPWEQVKDELVDSSPFLQGAPRWWAERIARTECLLGETPVSGGVVRAAFRRFYEGPIAEIVTDSGRKFSATPNHPMLTRRGWSGTSQLCEGDYLICYGGKQHASATSDEHVANPPSTIAEIFDALRAVGVGERRNGAPPDFHGDGRDGDVDVARSNLLLGFGCFAALYKPLAHSLFASSDRANASYCPCCHRLLSVQKQTCLCWRTNVYARFAKSLRDYAFESLEFARQLGRAFAVDVAFHNLGIGQFAPTGMAEFQESVRCGVRERTHQSKPAHSALHGVWTGSYLPGSTLGAHPGDIKFDRVREVSFREFRGHVFNLHTADGYFAINGAYTGNSMGVANRANWETVREADAQLGDMLKILSATFDERTAADSYAVHGQIRRPEEAFQSWFGLYQHPPNRPNDREVVVPHRMSWPIPPYLAWKSDADVAKRWQNDGRKGRPPPRPKMTTVPLDQIGKK